MKKHLIAAAVAGALAVPAMAQVTIGGRIDTSIANTSKNSAGKSQTRIASGVLSTSQLVFNGSEDLGGGLKAGFSVASQINTDETTNPLQFGSRGFLVGLSGGFGSLQLGKDTGNVMNSISGGLNGNMSDFGGVISNRKENSVIYTTPSLGGVSGRLLYSLGSETVGDEKKGVTSEVGITYKVGPINAQLAYGTADAGNTGNDSTETGVAVTYDFGMGKVNLRYTSFDQANGKTADAQFSGIGVQFPIGKAMTITVDYHTKDMDGKNGDYTSTNASLVYSLSKRTNAYLAYAAVNNESAASWRGAGSASLLNTQAGADPSIMAVGVRHSF